MDIYEITMGAINRAQKRFVLVDGEIRDWKYMLTTDGAITENPSECRVAIIRNSNGFYEGIDTLLFYERPDQTVMCPTCGDLALAGFNRSRRYFRLDDNSILPFIATLPADSDEYIVAVYKLPDGLIKAVDIRTLDAYPELIEAA
jgi:hypothetical protein